jgi:UDP-2-acetamido-3-amino-2,3-dideoxy-glucuronate N-acetyltransferase
MNVISKNFKHGENFVIGSFCIIEDDVVFGDNVTLGNFCIVRKNTVVGSNTVLMNNIELRPETIVGEDCYIDSGVKSSGKCRIGNKVTLRYDTIIARGVVIKDGTYVCPRVMTNNLNSGQDEIGGAQIGENCFIGTNAVLQHGIKIGNGVIIGAMSFVNKNCDDFATYVGIPAKKINH